MIPCVFFNDYYNLRSSVQNAEYDHFDEMLSGHEQNYYCASVHMA